MKIDFKDTKGVEVKGFSLKGTYEDYLEGSKQTVTESILQNLKREKGKLYIQPELVEDALKPYVFRLEVWYKWEYRMEVIWYDYDIPSHISFFDYLQQKVKDIEFKVNGKQILVPGWRTVFEKSTNEEENKETLENYNEMISMLGDFEDE